MPKSSGKIRNAIGRVFGFGGDSTETKKVEVQIPAGDLKERMEARFEAMMQEVDELSNENLTVEEKAEYGWIAGIRMVLPVIFFLTFGYEDGLFMTGFRYLSLEPFILMMYVIGYGLEGLRVAMVYSMNFSKSAGLKKAYRNQFTFWVIMSIGCGVAQLASALVIQALGADTALVGNNAVTLGAKAIMDHIPFLVYIAIGIRVGLCAVADWACAGHLHKKRETVEQKVTKITTRASNLQTIMQAHLNAQAMIDSAKHYQEMIADERADLKELRSRQKELSDMAFNAGMKHMRTHIEIEGSSTPLLEQGDEEE